MLGYKALAGMAGLAVTLAAVPAQAVTTFATFAPLASDAQSTAYANLRWNNSGSNGASGTSGVINSVTGNNIGSPTGSRLVSFSFLPAQLAAVATNINAIFTWTGSSSQIATQAGTTYTQGGIGGSFSFLSTQDLTVGTNFYAAGANLLSGTYTGTTIVGGKGATVADFDGSSATLGQTVVFTSDFLDFSGVTTSAFALDLENIRSALSTLYPGGSPTTPATALRTFRTKSNGSFGYEGELIINGVPEPQTWGLMVVGFGMVGLQVRRRSNRATAVTA